MLSFNLRASIRDVRRHWLFRRDLVRSLLDRYDPSLIAFQEVFRARQYDLSTLLPLHRSCLGKGGGGRLIRSYNPLFWRANELLVEERGGFWIGATPQHWCRDPNARFARTATWIVGSHRGREILILNTHLEDGPPDVRLRATQLLLEHLAPYRKRGIPVIVCGDFNAEPGSREHRAWLEAGLLDSWLERHTDEDANAFTFHGFNGRRVPNDTRIDWILFTPPLTLVNAAIVTDAAPPRFPSDHYPMLADFELPK